MSITEFLEKYASDNSILVRFERSNDPEDTHPISIQISWEEEGEWWEGTTHGLPDCDVEHLLIESIRERARQVELRLKS